VDRKLTWFSNEEGKKGRIEVGQFADLVVPTATISPVPRTRSQTLAAQLTIVGGKVVYGAVTSPLSMRRRHRRP